MYGGVGVQLHSFITAAIGGDEWSALRFGRCTPDKELHCSLNGRLGGDYNRSGRVWRTNFLPLLGFERRMVQPVA